MFIADRTLHAAFDHGAIAFAASWGLLVPFALVLVAVATSVSRRRAICEGALGSAVTIILVKAGALLYVHPRPFVVHHVLPLVNHAADNSFPSDHAAAAGLAVAYLWPRSPAAATAAAAFGLLVGAARIAAQLHWPIDIAGGYMFGVAGGLVAFACCRRFFVAAVPRSNLAPSAGGRLS